MNMRVCNILIGCLLFFAAKPNAEVIYQQTFDNPLGNQPLTNVNWNANVGTNAVVLTIGNGSTGPILSSGDFIYSVVAGNWLAWTDDGSFGSFGSLTTVSVSLSNAATNENIRIALKVDGSWYVSQEVLNNTTANTKEVVDLNVQSASWNSLTFVSGSTLAEGGAVGSLSGAVEAVGVYDDSIGGTDYKVRVDDFTVDAIPTPDPSAYGEWTQGYSLVGGAYDDDDQDGVGNLYEFGMGGDPTNALDTGYSCEYEMFAAGGTNWMIYVYPMMSATNSGLRYSLEQTEDLVSGIWTDAEYELLGMGTNAYETGFDAVTNQILITDPVGFIRLRIGQVFFLEEFGNTLGADTSLDSIGWHANVGTDAQNLDSSASYIDGPILSGASMMFFRPGSTVGIPWLGWTDVTTACNISDVTNVNIRLSNDNLSEDLKIALKIDGGWYVSQDVVNNPELGWNYVNLDVKASGWNSLTFVSGVALSEGSAVSLPSSGMVQAVGVFDAATTVGESSEKSIRVDDLRIDG